jgi:hypothetical protein
MADSSDSSSNSSGSSIASSNASLKDLEAPDGNDSKPNKKQKFLLDFFKIKRKRRRPKKATTEKGKPKRGRPPSQPKIDPLLLASSNPSLPIAHQAEDCNILKAKKTRINWAVGRNAEVMRQAVEDWDKGKRIIDENGDTKLTLTEFANLRGIKPDTFQKYAHVDRSKRRALGSQVGTKAKLSTDDQEFIAQVVTARSDRANDDPSHSRTITGPIQVHSRNITRPCLTHTFSQFEARNG